MKFKSFQDRQIHKSIENTFWLKKRINEFKDFNPAGKSTYQKFGLL